MYGNGWISESQWFRTIKVCLSFFCVSEDSREWERGLFSTGCWRVRAKRCSCTPTFFIHILGQEKVASCLNAGHFCYSRWVGTRYDRSYNIIFLWPPQKENEPELGGRGIVYHLWCCVAELPLNTNRTSIAMGFISQYRLAPGGNMVRTCVLNKWINKSTNDHLTFRLALASTQSES